MPLHRCDALILKTFPYRDADQIAVFYSAEDGQRRGLARGSRRHRSRLCGALQPLRIAQIVFFEKQGRDLVTVDAAAVTERFPRLEDSLDLLTRGMYLLELLLRSTADAPPQPPLFRLVTKSLRSLNDGQGHPDLIRIYVEYHLLRLNGVLIDPAVCESCGRETGMDWSYFDPLLSRHVCARCHRPRDPGLAIGGVNRQFLTRLARTPVTALPSLLLTAPDAREMLRFLGAQLERLFENTSRVQRFSAAIDGEPGGESGPWEGPGRAPPGSGPASAGPAAADELPR